MEPAASSTYRSIASSSSGDLEGSAAQDDLEQQQPTASETVTASEMRKKRLLFARPSSMSYAYDPPASSSSPIAQVRRRLSNEDVTKDAVVVTPPPLHGILKRGRYSYSTPSSSSNHPRRNKRAHKAFSAMFLIGTVAFIIGSVANVLNGGQLLLPTLLMTADSRRLKSSREANKAAHDAFMTMLRAETAGLPEEERQRVSVLISLEHKHHAPPHMCVTSLPSKSFESNPHLISYYDLSPNFSRCSL
jgi:hypothetical protein